MSQYLSFYLRKKDNPETKVCLLWYCTTPARTIDGYGAFRYTQDFKVIDQELFTDSINSMKEELETYKEYRQKEIDRKAVYTEMLPRCANVEVLENLTEKIDDCNACINDWDETIEELQLWIREISFCYNTVLDDQNEGWELIYVNC